MSTESRPMTAPPTLYAAMYPELVRIAREHGYALAVHGSMTRDFDLIAVPWTEVAGDPQPMIDEMKHAMGGVYLHHEVDHIVKDGKPSDKPHGRRAWSIHLTNKGSDGPYIDLSVMPQAVGGVSNPMTEAEAASIFKQWRSGPLWLHMVRETERHYGIGATP